MPLQRCKQPAARSGRQTSRSGRQRVGLVVRQRRAVDPGRVQPGGRRHRDRGGRVPLVLAAGVHVGVDVTAHHRGDLRPGRAHRHQLGADRPRPGRVDEGRRPGPAHRDPQRRSPAAAGPAAAAGTPADRRCPAPGAGPAGRPPRRPASAARRAPTAPRAPPSRARPARRTPGCRPAGRRSTPGRRSAGRRRPWTSTSRDPSSSSESTASPGRHSASSVRIRSCETLSPAAFNAAASANPISARNSSSGLPGPVRQPAGERAVDHRRTAHELAPVANHGPRGACHVRTRRLPPSPPRHEHAPRDFRPRGRRSGSAPHPW